MEEKQDDGRIDIDSNGRPVDFQVRYWMSPGRRQAACLRRLSMCSAAGVALGIALGIPVVCVACLGDDKVDVVVRGQQSAQGFGLQWTSVRGFADCKMQIAFTCPSHSCLGGRNALAAGFHDLCLATNMCLSLYHLSSCTCMLHGSPSTTYVCVCKYPYVRHLSTPP